MIEFFELLFNGFYDIVLQIVSSGSFFAYALIAAFTLAFLFNLAHVLLGGK